MLLDGEPGRQHEGEGTNLERGIDLKTCRASGLRPFGMKGPHPPSAPAGVQVLDPDATFVAPDADMAPRNRGMSEVDVAIAAATDNEALPRRQANRLEAFHGHRVPTQGEPGLRGEFLFPTHALAPFRGAATPLPHGPSVNRLGPRVQQPGSL